MTTSPVIEKPAPAPVVRRDGTRRLLAGCLLVLAWFAVTDRSSSFTSDDGAYAYQVDELLRNGDWVVEDVVADLPPLARPLNLAQATESGQIPYSRHPLPVLSAVAVGAPLGRTVGLWFLPLVGLVAAAASAHALAERLHPGSGTVGFWLILVGPLLVNGSAFWAHAPSAAVAGWLVVGALDAVVGRGSRGRLFAVMAAAAILPLLRSEGLLFVIALALACAVSGSWRGCRVSAGVALPALGVTYLEGVVVAEFVGAPESVALRRGSVGLVAGRLEGAWHSLADPSFLDGQWGALLLVALVLVGVAVFRVRVGRVGDAAPLLVAASVVWAAWALGGPTDLVTGLAIVWPVLFLGLAVSVARDRSDLLVATTLALFAGAVLVTQYPDGGGAQWGGRFFTPSFPLLVALVAPAVGVLVNDRRARWPVIAIVVVPVLAGLLSVTRLREQHAETVAAATASETPVVVTELRALPRLGWAAHPDTRWVLAEAGSLENVIAVLHADGIEAVAVHGFVEVDLLGAVETVSPVLRIVHAA
ncbi:MAG: hypothetical protein GY713_19750 [Actinomycetia bacterium]|nr:hypothetical protein [Actinomycetes bacterium]